MKIVKLLILGGVAWMGALYYNRYHAISNVATGSGIASGSGASHYAGGPSQRISRNSSGRYGTTGGGIGAIGGGGWSNGYSSGGITVSKQALALMEAAAKGDKAAVQSLLEKNTAINSRDGEQRTALMFAAWSGQNDTCIFLLNNGASAGAQDADGFSAIDYAAGRGLTDTVQLLLERGGLKDGTHALEYAGLIRAVYSTDTKYLPAGTLHGINRINPEGASPLHLAAGGGMGEMIEALLARGADIGLINADQQTPLHWAAWNDQAAAIAILAKHGAALEAKDSGGNTPLMLAAENHHLAAAKALLSLGASKTATNRQGKTARMIAEDKAFNDMADGLK